MKKGKTTKKTSKKIVTKTNNKIKKISEPALDSYKEIEKLYSNEKNKIDSALTQLEKARLKSYIDLTIKRKTVIEGKKNQLEKLENKIKGHIGLIRKKITISRNKKDLQNQILDKFNYLKEHLKNMELQEKKIISSRKELLNKEKSLLIDINSFFKENETLLNKSDKNKTRKISQIVNHKAKLISDAVHLANEDISILFQDKNIIDNISKGQIKKLEKFKTNLNKLYDKRHEILNKKILVVNDKTKIEGLLNKIKLKENKLGNRLRKIGKK